MNHEEVLAAYSKLLARAELVYESRCRFELSEPLAVLSLNGDVAVLSWPRAESDHDCPYIETETFSFPAALLSADQAEVLFWAEEDRRIQAAKDAARRKQWQAEAEARERAQYNALKRKYG